MEAIPSVCRKALSHDRTALTVGQSYQQLRRGVEGIQRITERSTRIQPGSRSHELLSTRRTEPGHRHTAKISSGGTLSKAYMNRIPDSQLFLIFQSAEPVPDSLKSMVTGTRWPLTSMSHFSVQWRLPTGPFGWDTTYGLIS